MLDELNIQVDKAEADLESLSSTKRKGKDVSTNLQPLSYKYSRVDL